MNEAVEIDVDVVEVGTGKNRWAAMRLFDLVRQQSSCC